VAAGASATNARSACTARVRPSSRAATSSRVVFEPMSTQAHRIALA
jgi:hypothetical protein